MAAVHPSDHPFPEPDHCPKCKLGIVLESDFGWWCSRRYYQGAPCDWEQGDSGPAEKPRSRG